MAASIDVFTPAPTTTRNVDPAEPAAPTAPTTPTAASPAPSPRSMRRDERQDERHARKLAKQQTALARKPRGSKSRAIEDAAPVTKNAAMRPADDVVKRLRTDPDVPVSDMLVGYDDRFLGIIEKPFLELNWSEYSSLSHVAVAIPKHRIVYFKYRTRLVWDRRTRLDDVFGSQGGLRLQDVIRAVADDDAVAAAAAAIAHTMPALENDQALLPAAAFTITTTAVAAAAAETSDSEDEDFADEL